MYKKLAQKYNYWNVEKAFGILHFDYCPIKCYLPVRALGARFLGSSKSFEGLPPPKRCLLGLCDKLGRREYGFLASTTCDIEILEFNFGQSLLEHI